MTCKGSILKLLRFLLLAIVFNFAVELVNAQDGEALFKANCSACHKPNAEKLVGPGLKDVQKRRPEDWLLKWIKNSQAVVASGDAYAVKIFEEFNKTPMPAQSLSDAEIKAVLKYIKDYKEAAPAVPIVVPGEEPADEGFPWILLIITVVLIVLAVTLGKTQKFLKRAVHQKEGLPAPVEYSGPEGRKSWFRNNKKPIALVIILLAVVGIVNGWYALKGIGVTQGYKPDQPIKFSHKIHAGDNEIQCLYCHSGAEKSRHANIPSANVCMNCHKYISKGTITGDTEIKKIYAAVDWDGSKYGPNQKPIQWVRVHNLPDLAYFNHAQHVKVGKIDCTKCHGDVQKMDVVAQDQLLTMGWCIECHRTTEVQMTGNGYYTQLQGELQKKYNTDKITVDKIGGLDCERCHY